MLLRPLLILLHRVKTRLMWWTAPAPGDESP